MKTLKKLFHGSLWCEEKEGYLVARRFTKEQMEYFKFKEFFFLRTLCGASVTLEFATEATEVCFDYKFFTHVHESNTLEVYTNGILTHVYNTCDLGAEGNLRLEFQKGEKKVEIYMPYSSEMGVKDFSANGAFAPIAKKKNKVLVIGDSITQGSGSNRGSQTFVNIMKREMNYEIVNQALGSYYCDENGVTDLPFKPNKIVVAQGANHTNFSKEDNQVLIENFFKALYAKYGNTKTLVILPIYCGKEPKAEIREKFKTVKEILVEVTSKYPHIQTVDAFDFVPHFSDYYTDDFVHPNALGMEVYGNNLVKAIKKMKF